MRSRDIRGFLFVFFLFIAKIVERNLKRSTVTCATLHLNVRLVVINKRRDINSLETARRV